MAAKILFVDDEPDLEPLVLRKFRRQIRDSELSFEFSLNGEDALKKLQFDDSIAIVFSDINMPVMDGLTLLTRIGQLGRVVKTVIVSAYDDMSNIRTAMNLGAFDFLTKPIDFADFETTLSKTLSAVSDLRESALRDRQLLDLQTELDIASRIQQDILPRDFPLGPHLELYAAMLPARTVGGDFYDFLPLDADRLVFTIGDVSGKGIPAAIFMAMCRTLLRAVASQHRSPRDCLLEMNRALLREGRSGMFVTLCHGIFDARSGTVEFCVAGQTPPCILQQNGTVRRLGTGGNMIGIFEDPEIGSEIIRLQPGETFFLYTDGVPDAENTQGNAFAQRRLETVLMRAKGSARETVESVIDEVKRFSTGAPQADDVTAMAIRFL